MYHVIIAMITKHVSFLENDFYFYWRLSFLLEALDTMKPDAISDQVCICNEDTPVVHKFFDMNKTLSRVLTIARESPSFALPSCYCE